MEMIAWRHGVWVGGTHTPTQPHSDTERERERERERESRLFMGGLANEEFEDNAICISFIW